MTDIALSTASRSRQRLIADGALLLVALIWGSTFFMIKDATSHFAVLAFLTLRFAIAFCALIPFMLRTGRWPQRAEWRWGILAGVLLGLSYAFQTFALRQLGAGRTGFLTSLYVVMVPFAALLLLRHPLRRRVLIGTACAVVGLILLSEAPGGDLIGDGLGIGCAALYALQILAVERFPKGSDWRIMAGVQLGTVAAICGGLFALLSITRGCDLGVCLALRPFADPLPPTLPIEVLAIALFTGITASSLAFSIQIWAQRILPPSDATLIYALESPFAALFGVIFLGEVLTIGALIGAGLMLAGMLITALGGESAAAS